MTTLNKDQAINMAYAQYRADLITQDELCKTLDRISNAHKSNGMVLTGTRLKQRYALIVGLHD